MRVIKAMSFQIMCHRPMLEQTFNVPDPDWFYTDAAGVVHRWVKTMKGDVPQWYPGGLVRVLMEDGDQYGDPGEREVYGDPVSGRQVFPKHISRTEYVAGALEVRGDVQCFDQGDFETGEPLDIQLEGVPSAGLGYVVIRNAVITALTRGMLKPERVVNFTFQADNLTYEKEAPL